MAAHACPPGIPLLTSKGLHFSAFSVKMRLLFLACMLHMCYRSNTDSCIMCVLFYGFNSTVVTKNCSCIAVCVCVVVVVVVCVCVCVCVQRRNCVQHQLRWPEDGGSHSGTGNSGAC